MPLTHRETMEMEDHYQVLGLKFNSSVESIRSSYKQLSLTCHPDKLRSRHVSGSGAGHNRAEEAAARAEAQERWAKIEQAHEILSDPITRALYDIDAGYVEDSEAEHFRIARLKRKEAQRAIATMEETVNHIRNEEQAKSGLLILAARYGDLSASDLDAGSAVSAPYIDVAVPLQCMVHDSALILPEGRSRFWLEGFYDPSMGQNPAANRLYIKYRFLGQLHEAEFGDEEAVAIPLEEHCIDGGAEETGATSTEEGVSTQSFARAGRPSSSGVLSSSSALHNSSSSSRAARLAKQKARRRMLLFGSLIVLGAGAFLLKRRGVTVESAKSDVQVWGKWIGELMKNKMMDWKKQFDAFRMQPINFKRATTASATSSSSSSSSSAASATPIVQ